MPSARGFVRLELREQVRAIQMLRRLRALFIVVGVRVVGIENLVQVAVFGSSRQL